MPHKEISNFFCMNRGIISVSLFGSQATGLSTEQSDIDIAALFHWKAVPHPVDIIYMREDLSELLRREVDLVCLNYSSPIMGMQVLQSGKNVCVIDEKAYIGYTTNLFTAYMDLKHIRKPMEDAILARKYYGSKRCYSR